MLYFIFFLKYVEFNWKLTVRATVGMGQLCTKMFQSHNLSILLSFTKLLFNICATLMSRKNYLYFLYLFP